MGDHRCGPARCHEQFDTAFLRAARTFSGLAGGILRDVLRREIPWVFQAEVNFYATAVFAGAVVFLALREYLPPSETHRYIGMATIVLIRLAAMRWKLRLPTYRTRGSGSD